MNVIADARPVPERTVRVALGARSYDIVVGRGVVDRAGAALGRLGARAAAIVTDSTVAPLHAGRLRSVLEGEGLRVVEIAIPPGEASKSFGCFAEVCDSLLAARIERTDAVVALGGGVVGDLAGFAASAVRRGVRLVQVPTTLLAQVDSSVGGKTGINTRAGKNLVGAFYQPSLVLADTAALDTLPERELKAGYAEVVKYGLIDDPAFFAFCEGSWADILGGGPARDRAVEHACRAKSAVVARDEREEGDRALLNLGHTFAHALERHVAYDGRRLVHGEAVAIGLVLAFRLSAFLGLCGPEEGERVAAHLRRAGLPTSLGEVPGGWGDPGTLLDAMAQDKKVRAGRLTFILARGIGRSFVAPDIPRDRVAAFLDTESSAH